MTTDIATIGIKVDDSQVKKASGSLQNLTSTGTGAEIQTKKLSSSYDRMSSSVHKATDMMGSMGKTSGMLSAQNTKLSSTFGRAETEAAKAAAALKKFNHEQELAEKKTKKLTMSLGHMAVEFGKAAAAFAVFKGGLQKSMSAAMANEGALISLASTANATGNDMKKALAFAEDLTKDGFLSMAEASLSIKNLLALGMTIDQIPEVMAAIKDMAVFGKQAHLTFGQAVVSSTEGLRQELSSLSDNAGMTKNLSIMIKEYAKAHGILTTELTKSQKAEAYRIGVLKEGQLALGNMKLAMQTYTAKVALYNKTLNDTYTIFGKLITPAAIQLLNALNYLMMNGIRPFFSMVRNAGVELAVLVAKLDKTGEMIMNFGKWNTDGKFLDNMIEEFKTIEKMGGQLKEDLEKEVGMGFMDMTIKKRAMPAPEAVVKTPDKKALKALKDIEDLRKRANTDIDDFVRSMQKANEAERFNLSLMYESTAVQESMGLVRQQSIDLEEKIYELKRNNSEFSIEMENRLRAEYFKTAEMQRQLFEERKAQQEDWKLGAIDGMKEYAETTANMHDNVKSSVTRAFKGMEDALVEFTKTGKLNFKDMARSIIEDLIRIQIQQSIMKPLAAGLSGMLGGMFGGAGGGFLGGLSGGGPAIVGAGIPTMVPIRPMATGTPYVPHDGLAYLHEGEAVVPATMNNMGGGTPVVNQNITINAAGGLEVVSQIKALMPGFLIENRRLIEGVITQSARRNGGMLPA